MPAQPPAPHLSEPPPYRLEVEARLDGFHALLPSQPLDVMRLLGALSIFAVTFTVVPAVLFGIVLALGVSLFLALDAAGASAHVLELLGMLLALPSFGIALVSGLLLSGQVAVVLNRMMLVVLERLRTRLRLTGRVLEVSSWRGTTTIPLAAGLDVSASGGMLRLAAPGRAPLRLWTGQRAAAWTAAQLCAEREAVPLGSEKEIPAAVAALRASISGPG